MRAAGKASPMRKRPSMFATTRLDRIASHREFPRHERTTVGDCVGVKLVADRPLHLNNDSATSYPSER
jgi:hypothetical protein